MKGLSKRQEELLGRIARCWREEKAPVVAELAEDMGLAGQSSVTPMLHALQKKGYLTVTGGIRGRQRRLALTPLGKAHTGDGSSRRSGLQIPVLGTIPAGPLREAVQEADRYLQPGDALRTLPGDFFLEVDGDSMIGDGILPGDYVLLRPQVQPHSGEIAAVLVGEDYSATLKHIHYIPGTKKVRLRPSNPAYDEVQVPAAELQVAGVYRGLIRPYGA